MKNIKAYEEFVNEGLFDKVKSGLHKIMTNDKQRKPEEVNSTEISKTNSQDTKSMKDVKPVTSKIGRVIKGDNAFIDTKSGQIVAMDKVLNKDELSQVIELWNKNDKKGAASILKNFAIRERNLQFNTAVALMMSALCVGTGACIPKLKAQTTITDTNVTDIIQTDGVGYKDAFLKYFQQLGDKLNISNSKEFINGSASKEEMFNLFDTMAKNKGISTNQFLKDMFSISHNGDVKMINAEINYLNDCMSDPSIKSVGQIFSVDNSADMTGVKGFKPFGIASPENAEKLQNFFNDTVGIGKKVVNSVKKIITHTDGGNVVSKDNASMIGATAASIGSTPTVSGVKSKKNESIKSFDNFFN